ncbi:LAETG motif-containing sortase-dependent surface protein [Streptomyces cremeus]|uniref:LAETG motif-containing sortase-dependent surface protein n=1 Tax=Streptomyces cremeus TaxID=66881 RepID=A0ABV5PHA1_STRCM
MKLRRSLALAAATAVIAPVSLLSATAAFADTPVPGSTPTATPVPGASQDDKKPGDVTGEKPADKPGDKPADKPGDKPADKPGGVTGEKPADKPGDKPGDKPDDKPAPGEGDEEGVPEMPPYCEEIDEGFVEEALDAKISGLPGKIVAGSGWKNFSLQLSNVSKTDLKEVAFWAEVENYELDEDKFLSKFVTLQFKEPESGKWIGIGDKDLAGDYFWGVENIRPNQFVKIDLRVGIDKNAPAGDSYTFGTGAYLANVKGKECIAENYGAEVAFAVLKPGTDPGKEEEAKPVEPGEKPGKPGNPGDKPGKPGKPGQKPGKPGPDHKPQGDVQKFPVTGNLAETGASSQLPMFALAGGAAVALGVGAMFVVRRKKAQA